MEDERPFATINDTVTEMQDPITRWDVEIAFRGMKNSPGRDGIRKRHLKGFNFDDLAVHMSPWPLTSFKTGIVTFIPKNKEAFSPSDYRPITVGPIMARLFQRILGGRMLGCWPLSSRQKAFRPGDGMAQNLILLKSIIRKKREQLQKLNLTFIRFTKAFDSVSHKSFLRAAARLGTPPLFLDYLAKFYKESEVHLKSEEGLSGKVQMKRGVRQGDPMSPHLFNAVIDMITSEMDQSIGVTIGWQKFDEQVQLHCIRRRSGSNVIDGHWNEETDGTIRECNEQRRTENQSKQMRYTQNRYPPQGKTLGSQSHTLHQVAIRRYRSNRCLTVVQISGDRSPKAASVDRHCFTQLGC